MWDPDPDDTAYLADFGYLLRNGDGAVTCVHDRHVCGVFPRATWLSLLDAAGIEPRMQKVALNDGPETTELFVGRKR